MRPAVRRLLIGVGAVVVGVACVVAGLAPARALVVAAGVGVVAVVLLETRSDPMGWPAPLPGPSRSAWTEVERLAAAVDGAGSDPRRFDATVARRLHGLARDTLARAGVPWADGRAADLLGVSTWEALERLAGDGSAVVLSPDQPAGEGRYVMPAVGGDPAAGPARDRRPPPPPRVDRSALVSSTLTALARIERPADQPPAATGSATTDPPGAAPTRGDRP